MPVETGVVSNNRAIHSSRPTMGAWLREAGYDAFYCGKWHLPGGYQQKIKGFDVLPSGGGQGDIVDTQVSRQTEAFLRNCSSDRPFVFVSSLLQPHDICYWALQPEQLVPEALPFDHLRGQLPALPPNFDVRPKAPEAVDRLAYPGYTSEQWRYYLYIYYRQVEMLDADAGRILRALEESGLADETIVFFTADHGDGRARHNHVQKWYPYDEAMKVPFIASCPARINAGAVDGRRLVSGVDLMATVCDYAETSAPEGIHGRSLRPLLEGADPSWREFLGAEYRIDGRIIRTDRFKYVHYKGDPIEQLFDMEADPWETVNLYEDAHYADVLADHRDLLAAWNARMNAIPPTPEGRYA
jgi:arylsulfatase A-like enzyme